MARPGTYTVRFTPTPSPPDAQPVARRAPPRALTLDERAVSLIYV